MKSRFKTVLLAFVGLMLASNAMANSPSPDDKLETARDSIVQALMKLTSTTPVPSGSLRGSTVQKVSVSLPEGCGVVSHKVKKKEVQEPEVYFGSQFFVQDGKITQNNLTTEHNNRTVMSAVCTIKGEEMYKEATILQQMDGTPGNDRFSSLDTKKGDENTTSNAYTFIRTTFGITP